MAKLFEIQKHEKKDTQCSILITRQERQLAKKNNKISHISPIKIWSGTKNFYLCSRLRKTKQRSVRLGVRTHGFHPCNRGSIPLRTTIQNLLSKSSEIIFFKKDDDTLIILTYLCSRKRNGPFV